MRIWFKIYANAKMVQSMTVERLETDTRTHKIFAALEEACSAFDLGNPYWLDSNIREFKRHAKTRFFQDNFVEEIAFDFLEMQVLEEDDQ